MLVAGIKIPKYAHGIGGRLGILTRLEGHSRRDAPEPLKTCAVFYFGSLEKAIVKRDDRAWQPIYLVPCPRCNGYLGIVLREPGRNTPLQAINGHCLDCSYHLAWIPEKTRHREALLKRIRELDAEIAQHERNLPEGEARLPLEEQLRLKLRLFIEANIPELAGKIDIDWRN